MNALEVQHASHRATSRLIQVDMVRLLPDDVVELRMQRPAGWLYSQQAGQYAYIMVPKVRSMLLHTLNHVRKMHLQSEYQNFHPTGFLKSRQTQFEFDDLQVFRLNFHALLSSVSNLLSSSLTAILTIACKSAWNMSGCYLAAVCPIINCPIVGV